MYRFSPLQPETVLAAIKAAYEEDLRREMYDHEEWSSPYLDDLILEIRDQL